MWPMVYKNNKAFTLIELLMTMIVVSILATGGAYFLKHFIQEIIYAPRQMNAEMTAENIFDCLIEGDAVAKGLRFNKIINSLSDNQITFINQDSQAIVYRYDTGLNKIYRSINGAAESQIPSVIPLEINLSLISNKLFLYYDANEALTAVPANVRRISINLIVKTGNGLFDSWEGYSSHKSSVAVNKYQ